MFVIEFIATTCDEAFSDHMYCYVATLRWSVTCMITDISIYE